MMVLQRGRALSRADCRAEKKRLLCTAGFNGAARFHARIGCGSGARDEAHPRFNGAARFHARIAIP